MNVRVGFDFPSKRGRSHGDYSRVVRSRWERCSGPSPCAGRWAGDAQGAANVGSAPKTVQITNQRYRQGGLGRALYERPRTGKAMLPDTQQRQRIMALVCGPPRVDRAFPSICGSAPQRSDDSVLSESPPWRRPK
jgi:hypothetical protein